MAVIARPATDREIDDLAAWHAATAIEANPRGDPGNGRVAAPPGRHAQLRIAARG